MADNASGNAELTLQQRAEQIEFVARSLGVPMPEKFNLEFAEQVKDAANQFVSDHGVTWPGEFQDLSAQKFSYVDSHDAPQVFNNLDENLRAMETALQEFNAEQAQNATTVAAAATETETRMEWKATGEGVTPEVEARFDRLNASLEKFIPQTIAAAEAAGQPVPDLPLPSEAGFYESFNKYYEHVRGQTQDGLDAVRGPKAILASSISGFMDKPGQISVRGAQTMLAAIEQSDDVTAAQKAEVGALVNDFATLNQQGHWGRAQFAQVAVEVPVVSSQVETQVSSSDQVSSSEAPEQGASVLEGGTGAPQDDLTSETSDLDADGDQAELNQAIQNVETKWFGISNMLTEQGSKLTEGFSDVPGISDAIDELITPISFETTLPDENGKYVYDEASQDFGAKAIMGLKAMSVHENGKPLFDTLDGTYTPDMRDKLSVGIMTSSMLGDLRESMGLPKDAMTHEAAIELLSVKAPAEPAALPDDANQREIDAHTAAMAGYAQQKAQYDAKVQSRTEMDKFFNDLDTLHKHGKLDNEKAKDVNKHNIMMDVAHKTLSENFPGFLSAAKDFFENSKFGQIIGSFLAVIGIDVKRLWGEESQDSIAEATQKLGNNFEDQVEKLQADDPSLTLPEAINAAKTNFNDSIDATWSGMIPRQALKLVVGSDNTELLRAAIDNAYDVAAAQPDMASAKAAFIENLEQFGNDFRANKSVELDGKTYTWDQHGLGDALQESSKEMEALSTSSEARVTPVGIVAGQEASVDLAGEQGTDDLSSEAEATVSAAADGAKTESETEVELSYQDPGTKPEVQVRYGHLHLPTMAEYLHNNADQLGLNTVETDFLRKDDGEYLQVMPREFSGLVQELWVRAKVHEMQENNEEITQEKLDALLDVKPEFVEGKPGELKVNEETLQTIQNYADSRGVDAGETREYLDKIIALDSDFKSPNNPDPNSVDGMWNDSVWDVTFENLIHGNVNTFIREIVPELPVEEPKVEEAPIKLTVEAEEKPPINLTVEAEEKPEPQRAAGHGRGHIHTPAKAFDELDRLNSRENQLNHPDVGAVEDHMHRTMGIDMDLEQHLNQMTNGARYVLIDLKDQPMVMNYDGQEHTANVIVASKIGGQLDIRFIDYEKDDVVPLREQDVANSTSQSDAQFRMNTLVNGSPGRGDMTVDELLLAHSRDHFGVIDMDGSTLGYLEMTMLSPSSRGGLTPHNAWADLAGQGNSANYSGRYQDSIMKRWHESTASDNLSAQQARQQYREGLDQFAREQMGRSNAGVNPAYRSPTRQTLPHETTQRQGEFNDNSRFSWSNWKPVKILMGSGGAQIDAIGRIGDKIGRDVDMIRGTDQDQGRDPVIEGAFNQTGNSYVPPEVMEQQNNIGGAGMTHNDPFRYNQ